MYEKTCDKKIRKVIEMDLKSAKEFLKWYMRLYDICDICELFDKEQLINNICKFYWDWAVIDEMEQGKVSKEQAESNAHKWFLSMGNDKLYYEKISDSSRQQLIIDKAEELEERTGKLRKILSELDKLAIQTDVPIYIGDREADYYIQLTDVIQILINNL